jgi:hypothetical protein
MLSLDRQLHRIIDKFKFFTCSIISDSIPQKIPLISVPWMCFYKEEASFTEEKVW